MKKPALYLSLIITLLSVEAWALKIYKMGGTQDAAPTPQGFYCLSGGGSDDAWASGWKKLLMAAQGGDIVIIRADGDRGGYDEWIYRDTENHGFPKVNSVTTLSFEEAADGDNEEAVATILKAEMVFFSGGDQTLYLDYFTGSRVEKAFNYVLKKRHVPFAGTSAGMAILAKFDYSGQYGSPRDPEANVTSEDVLLNPLGDFVDIRNVFLMLPFLQSTVTDSHFSQRDRHGRLVGFMARASYNFQVHSVKGIGVDEGTALCFDRQGRAQAHGAGSAFLLHSVAPIERIQPNTSLDWYAGGEAITVTEISAAYPQNNFFNLVTWEGVSKETHYWAVDGSDIHNPVLVKK